jgi:hypothetical protein
MSRFWSRMNPTLRGLLLVALVAALIVVLNLGVALQSLWTIARIAFFLAIAFFVYLVWRERRSEIADWPGRARAVFYGGALLIVADFGLYFWRSPHGPDALAFFLVLGAAGYAMWRTWRDQHTYA